MPCKEGENGKVPRACVSILKMVTFGVDGNLCGTPCSVGKKEWNQVWFGYAKHFSQG